MATVNVQANPESAIAGTRESNAVIITSEITVPGDGGTLVNYQIEKISTSEVYNIDSLGTGFDRDHESEGGNIVDVTQKWLKIILEFRTNFRVRTKHQFGDWGAWVNFKTRDKRYQSPHAITSLTDDTDSTAQTQGTKLVGGSTLVPQGGNRVIVVTNGSKATEVDNVGRSNERAPRRWGAVTVTNTDTVFNDGQLQNVDTINKLGKHETVDLPVVFTPTGAKVINVPTGKNARIRFTNRGAIVNTIG